MTDEKLAELLFTDPPGPYIVKGNITSLGILNDEEIILETFHDLEVARRFAIKVQTEGIEMFGMNIVFIAAWIELQASGDPDHQTFPAPSLL